MCFGNKSNSGPQSVPKPDPIPESRPLPDDPPSRFPDDKKPGAGGGGQAASAPFASGVGLAIPGA